MSESHYSGASKTSQEAALWFTQRTSPDLELFSEIDNLVGRAREVLRNDGYANGLEKLVLNHVVGSQFKLSYKPQFRALGLTKTWADQFTGEVERAWNLYANDPANYIDAQRKDSFLGFIRKFTGGMHREGEQYVLARWKNRGQGRPYSTCFQWIDMDRLSNPNSQLDTPVLRMGIEYYRDGEIRAHHIADRHPNDINNLHPSWTRITPFDRNGRPVGLYCALRTRPDQTRGVSHYAPALETLRMTRKLRKVYLQNAVLNATYASLLETDLDPVAAFGVLGGSDDNPAFRYLEFVNEYMKNAQNLAVNGVKIPVAPPGTKLNMRAASTQNTTEDFDKVFNGPLAANFGVGLEEYTRDYSKTNYSSARANGVISWKNYLAMKTEGPDRLATQMFSCWLEEFIARNPGLVPANAPAFADHRYAYSMCSWVSGGRGQIDELKETEAAFKRIAYGLSTYEREIAGLYGGDYVDVFQQKAKETDMLRELGLTVGEMGLTADKDAAEELEIDAA